MGWYFYVYPGQWYQVPGPADFRSAYQGALFSFVSPFEVLNISGLPAGQYDFYFGVDTNMNGVIDYDQLVLGSVQATILP